MKTLTLSDIASVAGGEIAPGYSGGTYSGIDGVWGGGDPAQEYWEGQQKKAAREEAERIAAETGENPLTVYADLMGY